MTTQEYVSLSYEEKRELLRLNGSFLTQKVDSGKEKRSIYALYGFFVELTCDLGDHVRYIRVVDSYFDIDTRLDGIFINLN